MTLSREGSLGGTDCGSEGERKDSSVVGAVKFELPLGQPSGAGQEVLELRPQCVVWSTGAKFGLETVGRGAWVNIMYFLIYFTVE